MSDTFESLNVEIIWRVVGAMAKLPIHPAIPGAPPGEGGYPAGPSGGRVRGG